MYVDGLAGRFGCVKCALRPSLTRNGCATDDADDSDDDNGTSMTLVNGIILCLTVKACDRRLRAACETERTEGR